MTEIKTRLGGPFFMGKKNTNGTLEQVKRTGFGLHPDIVRGLEDFNATEEDGQTILELDRSKGEVLHPELKIQKKI